MKKCLMIEMPDKKRFFTYTKNYNKLIDFANSFNCEISTVKLEEGEILNLVPLAEAISSQQSCKRAKYTIIEQTKPKKRRKSNN